MPLTPNEEHWAKVRARAKALGTDGCTGVADWYIDCCYEHDIACATGMDIHGNATNWAEAAARLRR